MTLSTRLRQSPLSAKIGMLIILLNLLAALFAPYLAPYSETELIGDVWMSGGEGHLLGTDHLGRDMLTRLLYGARSGGPL